MKQEFSNLAETRTQYYDASRQHRLRFEIAESLQTTLDIERLLLLFSEKLQRFVPHSGYHYTNPALNCEYTGGRRANHSCSYTLLLDDQELGELKLMRRQRFEEVEINQIENLLCTLIYPIRNATLYEQALRLAHTDILTNTNNRAALEESLLREWKLAGRQLAPLSVILLDVDHFKGINDRYGHKVGDQVLKAVATCIKETVRSSDIVFRYGGEEFVVLLSNTAGEGAELLAERVRAAIETLQFEYSAGDFTVTASLGIATLEPNESKEDLVGRADQAMYHAKNGGRNRVVRM